MFWQIVPYLLCSVYARLLKMSKFRLAQQIDKPQKTCKPCGWGLQSDSSAAFCCNGFASQACAFFVRCRIGSQSCV